MDMAVATSPIILSGRQEQFLLLVMAGKPAGPSYREVYGVKPSVADACASKLLRNPKVVARRAQLEAANAAAQKIDLPFLTQGLLRAYDLGLQTRQASAAAQAMMGVAKLHGFVIDRAQVDQIIRKPSLDPLSPDEMDESRWLAHNSVITIEGSGAPSPEPRDSTDQVQSEPSTVQPRVDPGGA